ncbi:MAG: hypothetical protein LKCHEGNO_00972 [Burkholderiaceae bacterium]|nr:hypothetical protein [Burkholderiaceae bacterium]
MNTSLVFNALWAPGVRRVAVAACVVGLSGCVVAPLGYYDADGSYGEATTVTDVAPPAPYSETVGVAPFVGAIWLGGYWGWRGGRYAWVPGHWGHARPGYVWHPYHWAPHGNRWALSGGWRRR